MSANRETVARMAYGYELMHTAISHMAGTSGADGRWYYEKANEVFNRVSPVFDIKADSNPAKPGDCMSNYKRAVPNEAALLEALENLLRASQPQNSMQPGFIYLAEAQEAAQNAIASARGAA